MQQDLKRRFLAIRRERIAAWTQTNTFYALSKAVLGLAWLGRRVGILTDDGVGQSIRTAHILAERARRTWAQYRVRREQLRADALAALAASPDPHEHRKNRRD